MAKIPYLIRRKNVFYFRSGVPVELREKIKSREIVQILRTQDCKEAERRALKLAAHFKALLHDLKTDKSSEVGWFDLNALESGPQSVESIQNSTSEAVDGSPGLLVEQDGVHDRTALKSPLLSFVVSDFLSRYDPSNQATLTKLNATLPLLTYPV